MNMKIARFLAWRYITGTKDDTRVSTVAKISFFSVFIGTLCLTLAIFIMAGFEQALAEKMQNIYPELVIHAPEESSFDYPTMHTTLLKNYSQEITKASPAHTKRVVIRSSENDMTSAVNLKAVEPLQESEVSSLETKLLLKKDLEKVLRNNSIIIGKLLAEYHNLETGDTATLLFSTDDTFNNSFESVDVTIGSIMETGIMQYDKYTIVSSLKMMEELLQDPDITEIGLKLKPKTNETALIKKLEETFGTEVHSWKTLYPALVSVTQLEKYVMFILLLLVTLIASANLVSLLVMQITRKRPDIAILKTIGLSPQTLTAIFIYMGVFISTTAAIMGLLTACIIGKFLQWYPFIKLPDAYFCTHLPVYIEAHIIILILLIVITLSALASWFSARSAQSINITQTLRFEG